MNVDWLKLWCEFPGYYSDNLRNNLFTGLLTMGTFLFAVKTFIVVKLKEDVFDTDFYHERVKRHRKHNPKKVIPYFAPLRRLTNLLFYAAIGSLLSAILQLTLGLVSSGWAALLCVFSAVVAVALLIASMMMVKRNLDVWIEEVEKQNDNKE